MMKHVMFACVVAAACAFALPPSALAQQSRMKECADQWNKMKTANQTAGKTYNAFSKECMSQGSATPKPAATAKPAMDPKPAAAAPKPAVTPAKPGDGRAAMVARERACGAEWKAEKAAGKIASGMTWPKYWSQCNTRKKAQGM